MYQGICVGRPPLGTRSHSFDRLVVGVHGWFDTSLIYCANRSVCEIDISREHRVAAGSMPAHWLARIEFGHADAVDNIPVDGTEQLSLP